MSKHCCVQASIKGGAVASDPADLIVLKNTTLQGNTAKQVGGALATEATANITLMESVLRNNKVGGLAE